MTAEYYDHRREPSRFFTDDDLHLLNFRERLEVERLLAQVHKKVRRTSVPHAKIFNSLAQDIATHSPTTQGRRVFDAINVEFFEFASHNLAELVGELSCGPEGERWPPEFFQLLYRRCSDPLVIVVALVANRRPLERIARFVDPRGHSEEAMVELIAEATSMLIAEQWDEELFTHLALNTRRRVRSLTRHFERECELDAVHDRAAVDVESTLIADDLLAEWTKLGIVTEFESLLIRRTRINGESLRDMAEELAVPYKTLQSQRLRAEKLLAGHLRRQSGA